MNYLKTTRNGLLFTTIMGLSGCSYIPTKLPPFMAPTVTQSDKPMLILILDTSGSMGEIDAHGDVKIAAAKNTLYDVVDKLPPDSTRVSLMSYRGCNTQLNVPLYNTSTSLIKQSVYQLSPYGGTPLARSIAQARHMLNGHRGKATVVLVSDGLDSCGGNPCHEAMLLRQQTGVDLKMFTFGYGVDGTTQQQLHCVAQNAGGSYYNAGNAISLQSAIRNIVTQEVTMAFDTDGDGILNKDDGCPATPSDFRVDARGCGAVYAFKIAYKVGAYKISKEFEENIKKLADYLLKNDKKLELGGHTDSSGSKEANQKLSLKRAEAVLQKLVEFGVPADRLSAKGYGESNPLNSNDTLAGRYKNRRVEALILDDNERKRIAI